MHATVIGLSFFVSISTVYGDSVNYASIIPQSDKTSSKIVNKKVNPKTIAAIAEITNSPIDVKEDVLEGNVKSLTSSLALSEDGSIDKSINVATPEQECQKVIDYTVEEGDTLWSIAKKFSVTTNTIKWSNNLDNEDVIKPNQVLKILPISGTLHKVGKGEDLKKIAVLYNAGVPQIIEENGLLNEDVSEGQILIVPGGVKPGAKNDNNQPQKNTKGTQSNSKKDKSPRFTSKENLRNSSGWLIRPTRGIKTQGFHCNNGIDIADVSMPSVWAAAAGTVTFAGWNGDYGLTVKIRHSNGAETQYSHLNKIYVYSGPVQQGQVIGQMGRTGRVFGRTGIHLHFEVHGGRNPF